MNNNLSKLLNKEENSRCADCGIKHPSWASVNIGVFLCQRCCGIHRSFGVHISRIKSVTLDNWTNAEINYLKKNGNKKINDIYEAFYKNEKPLHHFNNEQVKKFIQNKYINKLFYNKKLMKKYKKKKKLLNNSKKSKEETIDLQTWTPFTNSNNIIPKKEEKEE